MGQHHSLLNARRWAAVRRVVFRRDGWRCVKCGKAGRLGGTGTGKTHLAVAIARACIRMGTRGRCYNVVDLVNHLEAKLHAGRQGRTADQLS